MHPHLHIHHHNDKDKNSKIFSIIKYLLETSCDNSRTWAIHLRYLFKMYGIGDPLQYLNQNPPSKASYKENIRTTI